MCRFDERVARRGGNDWTKIPGLIVLLTAWTLETGESRRRASGIGIQVVGQGGRNLLIGENSVWIIITMIKLEVSRQM